MYKLNLTVGDRVRNIRQHSSRKGMRGYVAAVVGDNSRWCVIYDNGLQEKYLKGLAHVSLEKVYGECHTQRFAVDFGKLEERAVAAMWDNVRKGKAEGYILRGSVHDELIMEPKRRVLKKERMNVLTGKTQAQMVAECGSARGVQQFNTRALGLSTGQALRCIGDAMCNPTTEIRISGIDHAISDGYTKAPRHQLDLHFRNLVKSLIGNMKGFTFTDTHIVFNPIVTVETYVEKH